MNAVAGLITPKRYTKEIHQRDILVDEFPWLQVKMFWMRALLVAADPTGVDVRDDVLIYRYEFPSR